MIWAVLTAAALSLTACGKDSQRDVQDNDNASADAPEAEEAAYAYVPEYTQMEGGEFTSFQDVCFSGDSMYYADVFFDVVNQRNEPVLKEYSLTEKRILRERDMLIDSDDGCIRQMGRYCVLEDGGMYTVESEAGCIRELIEAASPVSMAEGRIMDIIREEAQPFFMGQKSAEEAADIIQGRVQNYLDERQR